MFLADEVWPISDPSFWRHTFCWHKTRSYPKVVCCYPCLPSLVRFDQPNERPGEESGMTFRVAWFGRRGPDTLKKNAEHLKITYFTRWFKFQILWCSPLLGEMIQSDYIIYFRGVETTDQFKRPRYFGQGRILGRGHLHPKMKLNQTFLVWLPRCFFLGGK